LIIEELGLCFTSHERRVTARGIGPEGSAVVGWVDTGPAGLAGLFIEFRRAFDAAQRFADLAAKAALAALSGGPTLAHFRLSERPRKNASLYNCPMLHEFVEKSAFGKDRKAR